MRVRVFAGTVSVVWYTKSESVWRSVALQRQCSIKAKVFEQGIDVDREL